MEGLDPWSLMVLLGENPANHSVPVNWAFADVAENWTGRDIFVHALDQRSRCLIVTEGSADAKILKKGLELLRPEVADFFNFVDMEEGYPFSGAGNLYRFCQGLVSIGILNQVLIIYDNDAEGVSRHSETGRLRFPSNMRAMCLPALRQFEQFATVGPNGEGIDDINGRAVSIECYLDLNWLSSNRPRVRWSSYNRKIDAYQGDLIDKDVYLRRFMDLRSREKAYDFSKLETVLDQLIAECAFMARHTAARALRC